MSRLKKRMKLAADQPSLVDGVRNARFVSMEEDQRMQADEPISYTVTFQVDYDLSGVDESELTSAVEECAGELQRACKDQFIRQLQTNKDFLESVANELSLSNEEALQHLTEYYEGEEFKEVIPERVIEITGPNSFSISEL